MKRIGIYLRTATKCDAEIVQKWGKALRDYSVNQGNSVVAIYADENVSGYGINRLGIQNLLEDCKGGLLDMVLAISISQLSRRYSDYLKILNQLKSYNVTLEIKEINYGT